MEMGRGGRRERILRTGARKGTANRILGVLSELGFEY